MLEKIEKVALEFALYLHSKPSIPRTGVIEIQDISKSTLFETIVEILEPIKTYLPIGQKGQFSQILSIIKNPFKKMNTDYLLRFFFGKKNSIYVFLIR